ncbi:MAG TPA: hypothetical protein VK457_22960 [Chloroflexota bacterium]|jgi:hypothetical protein|nr:hypothetical protein [Chloroflexota bacterium]
MRKTLKTERDDALPEYDFRHGVRGKYLERYAEGSILVLLDPDVAKLFPNAAAVNAALRKVIQTASS